MNEDSLLGKQIDEYRFEALLGQGGMARVYRAIDMRLNRYTAIKVIDAPYRADEAYIWRFEREAKAIAQLDHTNVVRLYRYGEVDGLIYMAMQYIEGADLGFVLRSYQNDGETMDPEEVLRITQDVCRALDYIHAHGIIHRDVKPSNIMLTREEARAVLTDFGLALRSESGTRGEVFGSPHYIAPEQAISSARAVAQSDLYSVGVMLYEMFTGRLPFDAPDPMDVAMMHMNDTPPPPRAVRPALSAGLEGVILKALEKKPEDRYPTGRALALALERALHSLQEIMPARQTVAERVTVGLAANPLPPLPVSQMSPSHPEDRPAAPPAGTPQPVLPTVVLRANETGSSPAGDLPQSPMTTQNLPVQKKRSQAWLGISLAVTGLLFMACLVLFGLALVSRANRLVSSGAPTAEKAAAETAAPTASRPAAAQPTATIHPALSLSRTATAEAAAAAPAAGAGSTALLFLRCEDEGCLVLVNQGPEAFDPAGLRLQSKESGMRGEEWGIEVLEPGHCARAVKNEVWASRTPEGVTCTQAGHMLLREGKERFWKDSFTITYGGEPVGECPKNAGRCLIQIGP